ncbi:MAG: TetR/AcrR family transcriptional regulator [Campylobacter sp.]|nr:TetR/AcrR family transcriptional regulator [Campylobacter sp.]
MRDLSSKAEERYNKILDAAVELFLKNGYDNTSLSDVVALSGGSLSTIYKHFKNKEELFEKIITNEIDNFIKDFRYEANLNLELDEFLYRYGIHHLKVFLEPRKVMLYRLITKMSVKKDIGSMYYKRGADRIYGNLTKYLYSYKDKFKFNFSNLPGEKNIDKKTFFTMAFIFIKYIQAPYFENVIIFEEPISYSEEEIKDHVRFVVKIFLHGILA